MTEYQLLPAETQPDTYRRLFVLYCRELQADDPTIAGYDPVVLADENLSADTDHPYVIYTETQPAGLVVFMDESAAAGEDDCHTYLGEIFVLPCYRGRGIASHIAETFFDAQDYDSGLCCIAGSPAETFWKNLMERKRYSYTIAKEDEIRNFIHIFLCKRETDRNIGEDQIPVNRSQETARQFAGGDAF